MGEHINGIDVSKWQGKVDWDQMASERPDIKFVIVKASEGVGYTDPKFKRNWDEVKRINLVRGAYHFARVSVVGLDKLKKKLSAGTITQDEFNKRRDAGLRQDAEAEATWFAEQLGELGEGDLPPVLDIEWDKRADGIKAKEIVFWVHAFLDKLEALTGRVPIIYTGVNYWRWKLAKTKTLTRYTLWLVQYTKKPRPGKPIQLPLGSKNPTWRWFERFWQWSHSLPVPGVGKTVDENRFIGSMEELEALAYIEKPEPVPPPPVVEPAPEPTPEPVPMPEPDSERPKSPATVEDVDAPWYVDLVSWIIEHFSGIARRSKTPMKNPENDLDHEVRIE